MNKTVRIFISSPGDVGEERLLVHRVIKRLQGELSEKVILEGIFWEQEPLLATADFQAQLPDASKADIAVFVLWSRLGTPLSADRFSRPDGSTYRSGTEYEFEEAVRSFRESGLPSILVYRKTADPVTPLKTKEEVLARLAQKDALDAFIEKWFVGSDGSFTAAFHPYASTAQFEEHLEEHLRRLIVQSLSDGEEEFSAAPTSAWEGSPFRGLEVFEFDHAPIFFGRTRAVGDILNALRRQAASGRPFVLVTGMSGVGKSSVVRAGVLPSLTQPGTIEGVGLWCHAIMRPAESAGDLFDGLAAALFRIEGLSRLRSALAPPELAETLRRSPSSALSLIKMALSQAAEDLRERRQLNEAPSARLVLVVDQLEEIFTLQRISPDERCRFTAALEALIEGGQVWIIATLRSDFYHRCAEIPELQDLKEGVGTYDLKPPSSAEILQMIRQPARIAGLRYEEDADTGARLDDALYNAVVSSAGALPLLEFTLQELFSICGGQGVLTFAAYHSLGGVEGSLAKRAETVFNDIPTEVRGHLPAVLSAVVEFGHVDRKTPVRRYVPLDSLAETPGTRALIDAFVQARLFVTDRSDDGRAVVSVAHEALLHHWPRLREWIEKNVDLLFQRTTLTEMAGRWKEAGEPPDLLLEKGKPLDDAEVLVEQAPATLTETEKAFVRTSTRKRRSQGKYAWLGGLTCWTVMVVMSARSTGNFSAGSSLVEMLRNNGILILLSTTFVAPIAWTTLVRWRAAPLTKELRAGRIFWAICLIAYAFILYLGLSIYDSPGAGDANTLGYSLIFAAVAYVAGDKWLLSYRRRRRIAEMGAPAGGSTAFRLPVRELGLLFVFLLLGAWFLINETGSAPKFKIETYRSFVRSLGVPRGIGPLAAGQSDLPYVYYQFSRNAEGRTVRVEQVGLPGMCVMAGPTNYQNLAQSIGFKEEACIFEYAYDAGGALRTETAYNKMGQQAWKLQYTLPGQAYLLLSDQKTVFLVFKRSAAGADEEIYQLNADGVFEASGMGQTAVCHRMAYDALGRVSRIQTVDLDGRPTLTAGRTHATTEFSHDAFGLPTEIRYFSPGGRLVLNEKGFAVETIVYDARGNMTEFSFLDAERRPVKGIDGYAEAAIGYDRNGRLTEISMLDETGRPVALANGVSRWTLDYDDNGNLSGQSVWGLDGGPARTRVAITAVCCEAEKIGLRAGDIIESYDGREVINHLTLDQRMRHAGLAKRSMTVGRDGRRMTFQVSPGLFGAYFSSSGAKNVK